MSTKPCLFGLCRPGRFGGKEREAVARGRLYIDVFHRDRAHELCGMFDVLCIPPTPRDHVDAAVGRAIKTDALRDGPVFLGIAGDASQELQTHGVCNPFGIRHTHKVLSTVHVHRPDVLLVCVLATLHGDIYGVPEIPWYVPLGEDALL